MSDVKCPHPTRDERDNVKYFDPNSLAFKKLQKVCLKACIINRIEKCSLFIHTTQLEVFHSKIRKFLPKKTSFDRSRTLAMTQICIMDWNNSNAKRTHATLKSSDASQELLRYSYSYSKASRQFIRRNIYSYNENQDNKKNFAETFFGFSI